LQTGHVTCVITACSLSVPGVAWPPMARPGGGRRSFLCSRPGPSLSGGRGPSPRPAVCASVIGNLDARLGGGLPSRGSSETA
jgi:hypothetical protein